MIKQLKKDITKDFGKKCKAYAIGCYTCMAWRAFEDLEQLYEDDLDFKINHDIT